MALMRWLGQLTIPRGGPRYGDRDRDAGTNGSETLHSDFYRVHPIVCGSRSLNGGHCLGENGLSTNILVNGLQTGIGAAHEFDFIGVGVKRLLGH